MANGVNIEMVGISGDIFCVGGVAWWRGTWMDSGWLEAVIMVELCSTDSMIKDKSVCLSAARISTKAWLAAWAVAFPCYVHMDDEALVDKSGASRGMWPISKESIFDVCWMLPNRWWLSMWEILFNSDTSASQAKGVVLNSGLYRRYNAQKYKISWFYS